MRDRNKFFRMQVTSTYKYAKISAFKAREVSRAIQGLPVSAALDIVAFSPKKAAGMIEKTLKSAIANAENNADMKVDMLVVKEATIGEAPTLKRFQPKARGSAGPILKRTSHIRIVLTDEIEIKRRDKNKKKMGKRPARVARKSPAAPKVEPAVEQKSAQPEAKSGE